MSEETNKNGDFPLVPGRKFSVTIPLKSGATVTKKYQILNGGEVSYPEGTPLRKFLSVTTLPEGQDLTLLELSRNPKTGNKRIDEITGPDKDEIEILLMGGDLE